MVNKIKIFICIPTLQCGGSEKYVATVCNHIDKEKFEVTVLVLDNSQPFYTIDEAVRVIDLQTPRARKAVFKIIGLVKERQPHILFSAASHLNILLAMFRDRLPNNTALIARESSLLSANSRNATLPKLYRRLAKTFYSRVDHIICQSTAMQEDLVHHFNVLPGKLSVLLNPVEDTGHVPVAARWLKFITVARLSKEKGIDRMLDALANIPLPYSLHIIGEGIERAALEALAIDLGIAGKVIFHGQKEKPFEGMEDAQLFLMASRHEGLPNAMIEAGARGIPVVAYDAPGGISEIILQGENGILVKETAASAFSAAIEEALETNFDRQHIQTVTLKRFSLASHLDDLEGLLERMAVRK